MGSVPTKQKMKGVFIISIICTKYWYPRNPKYQVRNNYALSTQEVRNIGYSCIFFFVHKVRNKYTVRTQHGVVRSTRYGIFLSALRSLLSLALHAIFCTNPSKVGLHFLCFVAYDDGPWVAHNQK